MSGFVKAKRLPKKKSFREKDIFRRGFPPDLRLCCFFLCLVVKHGHYRKKNLVGG